LGAHPSQKTVKSMPASNIKTKEQKKSPFKKGFKREGFRRKEEITLSFILILLVALG
jgi:hypothetical protein